MGNDGWIVCEACHKPIGADRPGIAVMDKPRQLPGESEVVFVHKGNCDPKRGQWQDMDDFFQKMISGLEIQPR